MRVHSFILSANSVHVIGGSARRILVRSATGQMQLETGASTIPMVLGDKVLLEKTVGNLVIRDLSGAENTIQLYVFDDVGADFESSAGAVEVANFPAVQSVSNVARPYRLVAHRNCEIGPSSGESDEKHTVTLGDLSTFYIDGSDRVSLTATTILVPYNENRKRLVIKSDPNNDDMGKNYFQNTFIGMKGPRDQLVVEGTTYSDLDFAVPGFNADVLELPVNADYEKNSVASSYAFGGLALLPGESFVYESVEEMYLTKHSDSSHMLYFLEEEYI